jgi:hypothetical protein
VPPRPAANVEDTPTHELEDPLLLARPLVALGEEDACRERGPFPAVVALEDQLTRLTRREIEQQTPERILLLGQDPTDLMGAAQSR